MEKSEEDLSLDENSQDDRTHSRKDNRYSEGASYNDRYSNYSVDHKSDQQSEEDEEEDPNNFYIGVSGQIIGGDFNDSDGIAVKYQFIYENPWSVEKGNTIGVSQHSYKSQGINKRVVWNFPFEVSFKSNKIENWPQIILYCSEKDFAGREVIAAYGSVHIPTQPGIHIRKIKMFKPKWTSYVEKFIGWLTGKNLEYINATRAIAKGEERVFTRVKSNGIVKVYFQITEKNFMSQGYKVSLMK